MAISYGPLQGIFSEPVRAETPHGILVVSPLAGTATLTTETSAGSKTWKLRDELVGEFGRILGYLRNYGMARGGLFARLVDLDGASQKSVLNFGIIDGLAPLGVDPEVAFYRAGEDRITYAYKLRASGADLIVDYAPFLVADEKTLAGTSLSLSPKSKTFTGVLPDGVNSCVVLDVHPKGGKTLHMISSTVTGEPVYTASTENDKLELKPGAIGAGKLNGIFEITLSGSMVYDSFYASLNQVHGPSCEKTFDGENRAVSTAEIPSGAYYDRSGRIVILDVDYKCEVTGSSQYSNITALENSDALYDGDTSPNEEWTTIHYSQNASARRDYVFRVDGREVTKRSGESDATTAYGARMLTGGDAHYIYSGEITLSKSPDQPPSVGPVVGEVWLACEGLPSLGSKGVSGLMVTHGTEGSNSSFGYAFYAQAPGVVQLTEVNAENGGASVSYRLGDIFYNGSVVGTGEMVCCVNPITNELIVNSTPFFQLRIPV